MWNILKVLHLFRLVTPEMRAEIRTCLLGMEARAKETKSPVDDAAVGLLQVVCTLLGLI